jgi:hypothetical protein
MLLTIKEYAEKEGISLPGAYKRVKSGNVSCIKKYGKKLIDYKKKAL